MRGNEHVVGLDDGTDKKTSQWQNTESNTFAQVAIAKWIRKVILRHDIKKTTVYFWLEVVEFVDVRMLDRVYNHLAPENDHEWSKKLAREIWKCSKACRQDIEHP